MSVESMAIALHHSRATGSARTILIGIANHDGDGGAWPALATLAKYGNVTRRGAQKAIEQLEQLREIERLVQRGGNGNIEDYRRPNLYKFLLTCPPDCDRSKNHRTRNSVAVPVLEGYPQGANHSSPGEPQFAGGANHSSPKPSNNHLTTNKSKPLVTERAREALTACEVNTDRTHRINRKLGYCADCLEPLATITSPNRKDGDA